MYIAVAAMYIQTYRFHLDAFFNNNLERVLETVTIEISIRADSLSRSFQ